MTTTVPDEGARGSAPSGGDSRIAWAIVAAGLVLAALKLWLVAAQPLTVIAPNYVDDSGFMRQALRIAAGAGLGEYDAMTLIKGPGYPLFVAIAFSLGVPLLLAQHALYAAGCAAFALACRHWIASPIALGALFALLLWNPITFEEDLLRPLREGIYPAQVLLVFAAGLEVAGARKASLLRLALASLGLSGALAWFWLTREEGVWVLPAIAIAGGALARDLVRTRPPDALARAACVALAALVPVAASAGWARHNAIRYGVPAVVELETPEFRAACGALQRAAGEPRQPLVPLSREARARIYEVSPTFAELRAGFEGSLGERWVRSSHVMLPSGQREIAGGWWMWAFRSIASQAGWHETGRGALEHYARLAAEVNAACDTGRLQCGPPHASLAPPLHSDDLAPTLAALARSASFVVRFADFSARPRPSRATPSELALFARASNMRLAEVHRAPVRPKPPYYVARLLWLGRIGGLYQVLVPLLSLAALAVGVWRWRFIPVAVRVALAALLALFAARLALVALIDTVSFPAVNPLHLAAAYPIWLAFIGLTLAAAVWPRRAEMRSGAVPSGRAASDRTQAS